ncbi:MAG: hypothetical protein SPI74_00525 [Eubacterium sp.]|nr:hypothetical protein [Eubacterium sp.]
MNSQITIIVFGIGILINMVILSFHLTKVRMIVEDERKEIKAIYLNTEAIIENHNKITRRLDIARDENKYEK